MGVHNSSKYLVSVSGIRECRHFLRYLVTRHCYSQQEYHDTEASMRQAIDQAVQQIARTSEERQQLVSQMKAFTAQQLIPQEAFDWLKSNPIAGFFAWHHIQDIQLSSMAAMIQAPSTYRQMGFKTNPTSHEERLKIIIKFFDWINCDCKTKYQQIQKIHQSWDNLYQLRKRLEWICNKNKEQLDWFENQLSKHNIAIALELTPNDQSEQYIALISTFLLSAAHPAEKKLALSSIKNAWRQKVFRKEQKAKKKKTLNTHLKEGSKEMLAELAAEEGVNMTEMLERLINRAYEQATR